MTDDAGGNGDPKTVLGITVILGGDGKRVIAYTSDTQDKDKIHMVQVRELLQWALTHANDTILLGMVRMEFDRAARTKIARPGFRPMSFLKSIVGGNGNER